jgi:hypothetical protein
VASDLLTFERFVRGELDAARFPHREHVRMAFEMLGRHDFAESVLQFSRILRGMAARAGKPQAFNQTITVAFLALISQRMEAAPGPDFPAFALLNPDLFDAALLRRWYRPEQLASPLASRSFLMPDPCGERR